MTKFSKAKAFRRVFKTKKEYWEEIRKELKEVDNNWDMNDLFPLVAKWLEGMMGERNVSISARVFPSDGKIISEKETEEQGVFEIDDIDVLDRLLRRLRAWKEFQKKMNKIEEEEEE